ncbi:MAG: hypothetical protein KDA05_09845 [Phycisphaerales bacterium]|nr:hypothetical protein [Phycisphaerales bacterium]
MSEQGQPSNQPPSQPPPQPGPAPYQAPPQQGYGAPPQGYQPRPPGNPFGFATKFVTGTPPALLMVLAVALFVIGSCIGFVAGLFTVQVLTPMIRLCGSIANDIALVCLVTGAARFVADAMKPCSKGE